jgi:hypothetical protein
MDNKILHYAHLHLFSSVTDAELADRLVLIEESMTDPKINGFRPSAAVRVAEKSGEDEYLGCKAKFYILLFGCSDAIEEADCVLCIANCEGELTVSLYGFNDAPDPSDPDPDPGDEQ